MAQNGPESPEFTPILLVGVPNGVQKGSKMGYFGGPGDEGLWEEVLDQLGVDIHGSRVRGSP